MSFPLEHTKRKIVDQQARTTKRSKEETAAAVAASDDDVSIFSSFSSYSLREAIEEWDVEAFQSIIEAEKRLPDTSIILLLVDTFNQPAHMDGDEETNNAMMGMLRSLMEYAKMDLFKSFIPVDGTTMSFVHLVMRKGKSDILESIFYEMYDENDQIKLVNGMDEKHRTILHLAAMEQRHYPPNFDWLFSRFTGYTTRELEYGKTAFQLAIEKNSNLFIQIFQNCPNTEVQRAMVTSIDNQGRSVLFSFSLSRMFAQFFRLVTVEGEKDPIIDENFFFIRQHDGGKTALHAAAAEGKIEAFKAILGRCPSAKLVLAADDDGRNVIHYAALDANKLFVIECLLLQHPNLIKRNSEIMDALRAPIINEDGQTFLHLAAKTERFALIHSLLSVLDRRNALLFAQDKQGRTACHIAVDSGEYDDALNALLDGCENADEKKRLLMMTPDLCGRTPMHYVVTFNKFRILESLFLNFIHLDRTNVATLLSNKVDRMGRTILHRAVQAREHRAVESIVTLCGDDDICFVQDNDGKTAVHIAAQLPSLSSHEDGYGVDEVILHALLDRWGQNDDSRRELLLVRDHSGQTALHYIVLSDNLNNLYKLLCSGCIVKNDPKMEQILRTAVDGKGRNVLHRASSGAFLGLISKLLDLDSTLFGLKDNKGFAVLHRAVWEVAVGRTWLFPSALLLNEDRTPRMNIDPNIRIGFSH